MLIRRGSTGPSIAAPELSGAAVPVTGRPAVPQAGASSDASLLYLADI